MDKEGKWETWKETQQPNKQEDVPGKNKTSESDWDKVLYLKSNLYRANEEANVQNKVIKHLKLLYLVQFTIQWNI